jgi:alanine dehydrogenase
LAGDLSGRGGAMDVGLIKDLRPFEHRIGLTPGGVRALSENGHRVYVENDAGLEAGFSNEVYRDAGATIVYSDEEVRLRSEMLIRLSPPSPEECESYRPGQIVLAAWHLAVASKDYFKKLLEGGVTTVGYEIIEDENGHAPVLEAMSEIAGRLAVTIGAGLVLNEFGGKGLLIGGAPGIPPATMVILGAGTLGCEAAKFARGIGAHVVVLDKNINALRRVQHLTPDEIPTMVATRARIEKALAFADILLCSVAVHGERTPTLVTRDMLKLMKPRSVIMDLSIDQGGCCETSRPTDFSNPTYEVDGIIHFCVPNLPSAASRASTRSLTNSIMPYVEEIANKGFDRAVMENHSIHRGTYTYNGHCLRESVAGIFNVPFHSIDGS